jgi:hypothetical protein
MSIKHELVVAVSVAIGAAEGLVGVQQQERQVVKPTEEIVMFVDAVAPPPTFAELLDTVDLAAHVRIVSGEWLTKQIPGGLERATLYTAEVEEAGRQRRFTRAGERIRILQMGGVFEESDKIVKVIDRTNPPLQVGRTYLLALIWDDSRDAYFLAYAAEGVFEIEDGKVTPRGRSAAVREFKGKSLREAIQRIK